MRLRSGLEVRRITFRSCAAACSSKRCMPRCRPGSKLENVVEHQRPAAVVALGQPHLRRLREHLGQVVAHAGVHRGGVAAAHGIPHFLQRFPQQRRASSWSWGLAHECRAARWRGGRRRGRRNPRWSPQLQAQRLGQHAVVADRKPLKVSEALAATGRRTPRHPVVSRSTSIRLISMPGFYY